ncbi:hypothetical protein IWQ51_004072 [Labrenzia sp. EL_142]|nr:hypothetical protein [Labrenzia sp. EL_142]
MALAWMRAEATKSRKPKRTIKVFYQAQLIRAHFRFPMGLMVQG